MMNVECEFCTPEAARSCQDAQCRARGYGYPPAAPLVNLDDPKFRAAMVEALWLTEIADDPSTRLMAGGGWEWAQAKTRRILDKTRVLLQRQTGDT